MEFSGVLLSLDNIKIDSFTTIKLSGDGRFGDQKLDVELEYTGTSNFSIEQTADTDKKKKNAEICFDFEKSTLNFHTKKGGDASA